MFHPLSQNLVEGIELPKLFTNPFDYEPHPLVEVARRELCTYLEAQEEWHAEIEQGKMFGVLVVKNQRGELGFLAAFSGYLAKQTLHTYFVPPIVNLLDPKGFFLPKEAEISLINEQITQIDSCEEQLAARESIAEISAREGSEIEELKQEYIASKARRRELREQGCEQALLDTLNAESQRQKGVIKRRELNLRSQLKPFEDLITKSEARRAELIKERQMRSAALQREIFEKFKPLNAKGIDRDLVNIFQEYNNTIPPAGSGECAAPKLLHYAFSNSLTPIAMGEFWRGNSTKGEVRKHNHYYPACRGKCYPILTYMLQGLDIEQGVPQSPEESLEKQLEVIYEDDFMVVFDKPSGLPSVKGLNHTISVQSIAEARYTDVNPNNLIVHRLDMDTSGIIIVAKSAEVQQNLQRQFEQHTIRKRYIALLDGRVESAKGAIDLPLIMDPLDRPRQGVDFKIGKRAYTFYSTLGTEGSFTRVMLYPQTGRTHQLRVHCAHHQGLNTPIVGDRLYGTKAERLMLHAEQITLKHPDTGRKFTLQTPPKF